MMNKAIEFHNECAFHLRRDGVAHQKKHWARSWQCAQCFVYLSNMTHEPLAGDSCLLRHGNDFPQSYCVVYTLLNFYLLSYCSAASCRGGILYQCFIESFSADESSDFILDRNSNIQLERMLRSWSYNSGLSLVIRKIFEWELKNSVWISLTLIFETCDIVIQRPTQHYICA